MLKENGPCIMLVMILKREKKQIKIQNFPEGYFINKTSNLLFV